MAKEKDEDAERDSESSGRIGKRRQEKAELGRDYTDARQALPDNPRDGPWGHTELPARNPAENVVPPLWEQIRSNALTISRSSKQSDEPASFLLAKALGKVQLSPHYWHPGINETLTQNLDGDEATRLYLFLISHRCTSPKSRGGSTSRATVTCSASATR